jgi:uncharacterized protein YjbJ (UPF0337 family)
MLRRHHGAILPRPTGCLGFSRVSAKDSETQMNWDRIEGRWKMLKGKTQEKWGRLTDDDLDVIEGKRTELAGRIQERYGYAKDQAEREIDDWIMSTYSVGLGDVHRASRQTSTTIENLTDTLSHEAAKKADQS